MYVPTFDDLNEAIILSYRGVELLNSNDPTEAKRVFARAYELGDLFSGYYLAALIVDVEPEVSYQIFESVVERVPHILALPLNTLSVMRLNRDIGLEGQVRTNLKRVHTMSCLELGERALELDDYLDALRRFREGLRFAKSPEREKIMELINAMGEDSKGALSYFEHENDVARSNDNRRRAEFTKTEPKQQQSKRSWWERFL